VMREFNSETLDMASSSTGFESAFTTGEILSIAAKTKKLDVNNRVPLEYYYRTADSLLKQVLGSDRWTKLKL
jgi:hypothetical protein